MKNQADFERIRLGRRWTSPRSAQPLIALSLAFAVTLAASLFSAPSAHAQSELPIVLSNVTLTANNPSSPTTLIKLDGLPSRPRLVVEVMPDPQHPDLLLEILVDKVIPDPGGSPSTGCPDAGFTSWSTFGTGTVTLEADLYACRLTVSEWAGRTAEVTVTAKGFGLAGPPATVAIEIRAETSVVTGTTLDQVSGTQMLTAIADSGTVVYEDDPTFGNGAGDYLWAGTLSEFSPAFGFVGYERNSLFRFFSLSDDLPSNAQIVDAEIELTALDFRGTGGAVDLFAIPPGPFWSDGNVSGPGDEFFGAASPFSPASYVDRSSSAPWLTPGGDTTTAAPLDTIGIAAAGSILFSSPALVTAVQDIVDFGSFFDGFKLTGPGSLFSTDAVAFASDDFPDAALRPTIRIEFDQPTPLSEGNLDTDLVDFVDEGENFRWIYDTDDDGVLFTSIGGICTDTGYSNGDFTVPYEYTFGGTPGYIGVDCCTWQIEGAAGTVGTGQALFFHNLNASDPANMPPDSDDDGIRDLCDNCPYTPNGPSLGSCVDANGATTGTTCRSNLECNTGLSCDLAQLEDDGAAPGLACPEPGFGLGAMLGALGLAALRPVARRRP